MPIKISIITNLINRIKKYIKKEEELLLTPRNSEPSQSDFSYIKK